MYLYNCLGTSDISDRNTSSLIQVIKVDPDVLNVGYWSHSG